MYGNDQMYDEEWGQFVFMEGDKWKYCDRQEQVCIHVNNTSPTYDDYNNNNQIIESSLTTLCVKNIAYSIICVYNFIVR
jgi:hypothetical protein